MSDKARDDATAALAKSQLIVVEVLRQTQATTAVMAASLDAILSKLSEICAHDAEILRQVEMSNGRHRESERNMRVVQSQMKDVQSRLEPLERALKVRTG